MGVEQNSPQEIRWKGSRLYPHTVDLRSLRFIPPTFSVAQATVFGPDVKGISRTDRPLFIQIISLQQEKAGITAELSSILPKFYYVFPDRPGCVCIAPLENPVRTFPPVHTAPTYSVTLTSDFSRRNAEITYDDRSGAFVSAKFLDPLHPDPDMPRIGTIIDIDGNINRISRRILGPEEVVIEGYMLKQPYFPRDNGRIAYQRTFADGPAFNMTADLLGNKAYVEIEYAARILRETVEFPLGLKRLNRQAFTGEGTDWVSSTILSQLHQFKITAA